MTNPRVDRYVWQPEDLHLVSDDEARELTKRLLRSLSGEAHVRARDGNRFLLVDDGEDPMRPARIHDLETDEMSDDKPLQVWFKWAEWDEADDADYEAAKATLSER